MICPAYQSRDELEFRSLPSTIFQIFFKNEFNAINVHFAAYQAKIGYARGVRRGPLIHIAGSTSFKDGVTQHPHSAYEQAKAALETSLEAISHLCAKEIAANPQIDARGYVTRVRMYVRNVEDCEAVGNAVSAVLKGHGDFAATLLAGIVLIAPEMLVEVEVDAWVDIE